MTTRPPLPTSSSDFALPPSTSAANNASQLAVADEFNPLVLRFRRPSLLAPPRATFYSEGRINSPLAGSVFSLPPTRRFNRPRSSSMNGEESESDRERMCTDSPPSADSGSNTPNTPALAGSSSFTEKDKSTASIDSDSSMKSNGSDLTTGMDTNDSSTVAATSPSTPSRRLSSMEPDNETPSHVKKARRISHPVKVPRILSLLQEAHPEEIEVKSEAQFQRFVSSFSDIPNAPRTPRAPSDRGRYPEEANVDEPTREDTPSDDEDGDPGTAGPFSYTYGSSSEPIAIPQSVTPAHSVNGDDMGLSESPSYMDIDTRPPSACGSPKLASWRYTPPPTSTSAVRSNKRKLDDRYEPYPTPAKRRAVSPSVSYLRETSLFSPRTPGGNGRGSLPHPIAIPIMPSSGASSPVVTPSGLNGTRPLSWQQGVLASPTLRAQIGLASPVLRPMMRRREEGREVDGAGDGVNSLALE